MAKVFAAVPDINQGDVYTVYVDKVIVTSSEREKVAAVVCGAHRELEGRGLLTHEADMGSLYYRALGFFYRWES